MHNETVAEKCWESNWGWLAKAGTGRDELDRFIKSHGAECTTIIKLNKREQHTDAFPSPRSERSSGDSVDAFVRQYMLKSGGASMR